MLKKVVDLFYNGQITIGTELKPQIINALIFLKVKDVEILERLSNVSQNKGMDLHFYVKNLKIYLRILILFVLSCKVPMVHVLPAPMMTKQMMPPLPILTNNVQYNRTNNDHQVSIRYIDHPCCDMFVNPMNIVSVHPIPHKNVPHLLRLTKVIGNGSANGRISSTYQGSVANHMTATKSMQQPHNQFEKKNMYNAQGANNGVGSMVSKVVENNGVDLDGDFYMEVDSR